MNQLEIFNRIIDEIEENLTGEVDVATLAKHAHMSVYEFRRIFAFIAGTPIGEYVRKRKLTKAAEELLGGGITVTELALKYGYDAPSSFTRAFKDFHGVSPQSLLGGEGQMNVFTKIGFDLVTSGGASLQCKIIKDDGFYIVGKKAVSTLSDTECCEDAWAAFYDDKDSKSILRECKGTLYAAYENGENSVRCYIGYKTSDDTRSEWESLYVEPSLWACFTLRGTADEEVNKFYKDTLMHWLKGSSYEKNNRLPNIELFPEDMSADDFEWEVRIPVCKAEEE